MPSEESIAYLRAREQAERAAAAHAADNKTRRLHLELADAYAARIGEASRAPASTTS